MDKAALFAVGFGLLATISWGIGDFMAAKASKQFGGLAVAAMLTAVGAILVDIVYIAFFASHTIWNSTGVAYALVSAVVYVLASFCFYKALEYGPVSIVSPLGSMYPVVTALGLVLFFGDHISPGQMVGIGLVMVGVAITSGAFDRVRSGRRLGMGPVLALSAMLCWGLAWVFTTQSIDRLGWQFATVIESTCCLLLTIPFLPLLRRSEPRIVPQIFRSFKNATAIGAAVVMTVGLLAVSVGIDHSGDLASVVVAASACYPIITVFLALRKLKEQFRPVPLLGALIGIVGIVVLSLG